MSAADALYSSDVALAACGTPLITNLCCRPTHQGCPRVDREFVTNTALLTDLETVGLVEPKAARVDKRKVFRPFQMTDVVDLSWSVVMKGKSGISDREYILLRACCKCCLNSEIEIVVIRHVNNCFCAKNELFVSQSESYYIRCCQSFSKSFDVLVGTDRACVRYYDPISKFLCHLQWIDCESTLLLRNTLLATLASSPYHYPYIGAEIRLVTTQASKQLRIVNLEASKVRRHFLALL